MKTNHTHQAKGRLFHPGQYTCVGDKGSNALYIPKKPCVCILININTHHPLSCNTMKQLQPTSCMELTQISHYNGIVRSHRKRGPNYILVFSQTLAKKVEMPPWNKHTGNSLSKGLGKDYTVSVLYQCHLYNLPVCKWCSHICIFLCLFSLVLL